MLNIEYKEVLNNKDSDNYGNIRIIVNGILDKDSSCGYAGRYNDDIRNYASVYNPEVVNILLNHSFNDIGKFLETLIIRQVIKMWEGELTISIFCSGIYAGQGILVNMQSSNLAHWNKPWSILDTAKALYKSIDDLNNERIKYWEKDDGVLNGFGINYFFENFHVVIKSEMEFLLSQIEIIVKKTNEHLIQGLNTDSLLTYFSFPSSLKISCQQYLIYFAQFIADMGIDVDTELKEEVNKTLFKITPKDKSESLLKIKEALDIYLNAPSHPNFIAEISQQNDIAAKQWEATVYFLKSQLSLAQSVIQAKDTAIENLQLSNYQYKQILDSKKEKDTEVVIDGAVSIKKYDGKFFVLDLPEIFRRLKRNFK